MSTRLPRRGYTLADWYEHHADVLLSVCDHFTSSAEESLLLLRRVLERMSDTWRETPAADRTLVAATYLYDAIHQRWSPPTTVQLVDEVPRVGAWSALQDRDRWKASQVLWAAEAITEQVDWVLLHIITKLEIPVAEWARVTAERPFDASVRVEMMQVEATGALAGVMLDSEEAQGTFTCPRRLKLTDTTPRTRPYGTIVMEHIPTCTACRSQFETYVRPASLIAGSVRYPVRIADVRQVWETVVSSSRQAPTTPARKWTLRRR